MRDLFDFFTPKDEGLGQVVAVTYNGMEVIGFITQTDEQRLPESFREQDKVLVLSANELYDWRLYTVYST